MKPDRLTKRIFLWDYKLNNNNWSSHIETILNTSYSIVDFNLKRVCEMDNVRKVFTEQFIIEWKQKMLKTPNLRTYIAFKLSFSTEIYVKQTLSDLVDLSLFR